MKNTIDRFIGATRSGGTPSVRLRLVRSTGPAIGPVAKASWSASTIACPSHRAWRVPQLTLIATSRVQQGHQQERRISHRLEKGRNMNKIENLIHGIGRFVFGLGIGLALTSVYVIVVSGPDVLAGKPEPVDVVRLDPVVVTIPADVFAKNHVVADSPQALHAYGRGAPQG